MAPGTALVTGATAGFGRAIAHRLFQEVLDLPILSPHGRAAPRWFAENRPFRGPAQLFVTPDHYVFRMLYGQGVA